MLVIESLSIGRSSASLLSVDVLVAVEQGVDRRPAAIGTSVAELAGDVHGARDILDHDGGLHGVLARPCRS